MRLNTANRSFVALVAFALVPYGLIGLFCCGALSVLAYRISTSGLGVLTDDWRLWPGIGFFVVVGTGTIRALWSLRRQLHATERLADHVCSRRIASSPELDETAQGAGLAGRVVLVDHDRAFSFTYGLWQPRVAVSRGLVDATTPNEIAAVLEHERYHVRNLDPLKVLVARAVAPAFFYLPAVRDLRRRYVAGRELAADRRAVRACGQRPLAGALYKATTGPTWSELGAAAAIGAEDLLDLRVAQLEMGREPAIPEASRTALVASVFALGLLGAALVFSLVTLGDPAGLLGGSTGASEAGVGTAMLNVLGCLACVGLWAWAGWAIARRVARRA
jgi:Zn-dependent protease with chaperone function